MKYLKIIILVIVLTTIASTAFSQGDDYWGEELYWNSGNLNYISSPVWSPDGQWIAFLAVLKEVYVIPSGGGEPTFVYKNEVELVDSSDDDVTMHTYSIVDLEFTPDSNELTFDKHTIDKERGTIVTIEKHDGGEHVSVSNSFTTLASVNIFTGEVSVHTDGTNPVYGFFTDWSHDGRYLSYISIDYEPASNINGALTVLDTETGERWFLDGSPVGKPFFTPDDSGIVFYDEYRNLYKSPVGGGEAEQIGSLDISACVLDMSLDGIWMLLRMKDENGLKAYNIQTEELVTVLNGSDSVKIEEAVFSPDGTQICYIKKIENDDLNPRAGHPKSSIPYIIDFNPTTNAGPAPVPVPMASDYGTRLDFTLSEGLLSHTFSPDGQWFATSNIDHLMNSTISIAPIGGGESSEIFNCLQDDSNDNISKRFVKDIKFSPDSEEIYYTLWYHDTSRVSIENEKGNILYDIECVNIDTGEHRVVVEGAKQPSWSTDGRYLVFINFDYMIYIDPSQAVRNGVVSVYDSQTGETLYLTDGEECAWNFIDETTEDVMTGKEYSFPSFSPDGSKILCSVNDYDIEERSTCVFPLEGGEPETLPIPMNEYVNKPSYSPDGNWIVYTDAYDERTSRLYLYNIQTTESIELVDSNCDPRIYSMNSPIFSADGSQIYYSMKDFSEEIQIYILDFSSTQFLKALYVESDTPESFALMSNFPNPFNPTTTIEFTLPEAGFTQLVIYNIMGQKIRELVSADMSAGVHSIVWDGCDQNGTPASSGVFVSRLTSGVNVVSNRMMLVK